MRKLIALMLLAACAAQQPQPQPATTPPPPVRPENAAVATGVVTDAGGRPVPRALVTAWAADPACAPIGHPQTAVTGADGAYQIRVEQGVGPQFDACIIVDARAGGAIATRQEPVHYAPDTAGNNTVRIDLVLPPAAPLTRMEADRLVQLVDRAMRGEHEAVQELALFMSQDVSSMYSALTPFSQRTRGIDQIRLVTEGPSEFVYEATGRRPGTSMRITIVQDSLTRIELE